MQAIPLLFIIGLAAFFAVDAVRVGVFVEQSTHVDVLLTNLLCLRTHRVMAGSSAEAKGSFGVNPGCPVSVCTVPPKKKGVTFGPNWTDSPNVASLFGGSLSLIDWVVGSEIH